MESITTEKEVLPIDYHQSLNLIAPLLEEALNTKNYSITENRDRDITEIHIKNREKNSDGLPSEWYNITTDKELSVLVDVLTMKVITSGHMRSDDEPISHHYN